ncbi:hypothetical protein DEIPH_ctg052orf0038 [Deinococcus phoenicis]|uniref:Uncharacterized protein n=1 Tax=Deinococcus phoenicis TaxID=1476583 RepID=A0A016QM60_9DEIO|nr:hypothetical protein [Deinococcus phoenicis]EYB67041.1 hypothetical protein DEIPH_ctg052orf0038 [Deinococcus phoenicis]
MGLAGTSKAAAPKSAASRNNLALILDQLDSEWATLKQDDPTIHGEDAGLLAYYHSCVRPALHWVAGDPYTFAFPESYQRERLAKLCGYLKSLQGADAQQVKAARERNLAGLRAVWPAYRELNPDDVPNGLSPMELECPPFTWAAIETGWNGDGPDDYRINFLPAFATKESADFHLAALAVLFLNRQLRYALTDLYPHQTDDGRN